MVPLKVVTMSATTDISITILSENRAGPGLASEHGFSLWIEAGERRILFDTGQAEALFKNAASLYIDLSRADTMVISHGHYDHTGGLSRLLAIAPGADVYAHPGILARRYSIHDGKAKPVHVSAMSMDAVKSLPAGRIHWLGAPSLVTERIGITGPIPRLTDYEDTGGPFYLDPEGLRPDPIEDDAALWIRTDQGLVVCSGCSHAGIINTLVYVGKLNQGARIRAIIGGFHLINAGSRRVERTAEALAALEPDLIVPCHCTGDKAVRTLGDALGRAPNGILAQGAAGRTYRF